MKVYSTKSKGGYYCPCINLTSGRSICVDSQVAYYLNVNYNEYRNLLLNGGAFEEELGEGYFFKTRYKCKKFIDNILMPKLILKIMEK